MMVSTVEEVRKVGPCFFIGLPKTGRSGECFGLAGGMRESCEEERELLGRGRERELRGRESWAWERPRESCEEESLPPKPPKQPIVLLNPFKKK